MLLTSQFSILGSGRKRTMDDNGHRSNRSSAMDELLKHSSLTAHRCRDRNVTFGSNDMIPHPKCDTHGDMVWLPSAANTRLQTVSRTKQECNKDKDLWNHHISKSMHLHYSAVKGFIQSDGDDDGVSEFRRIKRKLEMQSILLQQDIHRALQIHDPIAIAKLSAAYSINARTDAFQRARMMLEDVEGIDDIDSDSLSTCDDIINGSNDSLPVQCDVMPLCSSLLLRGRRHYQVDVGEHVDTKEKNITVLWGGVPNER
jgi:hypothetical protein